ncbi:Bro-N domain-containing protein [Salipiger sp.]|uniref:BRO-N domain-containing protein n=1 Tax=Salipiger sp. TaxID=2078585 RepID=UPI003A9788CD
MSDMTFNFQDHDMRVVFDEDGNPWWVGKDVCRALEINNNREAMARLSDDEKGVISIDTLGGPQKMTIVNEFGLYRLVFSSRKDTAEAFKRWLAHEVLPELRRTGRYDMGGRPEGIGCRAEADPPLSADYWLGLVREARRTYGRAAAARIWAQSPLPQCAPDPARFEGVDLLVSEFLACCCVVTGDKSDFLKSRSILNALDEYCRDLGRACPGDRTAAGALRRVAGVYRDADTGARMWPVKRSDTGFSGVRLRAD